jgi:hypothetical protein
MHPEEPDRLSCYDLTPEDLAYRCYRLGHGLDRLEHPGIPSIVTRPGLRDGASQWNQNKGVAQRLPT